MSSWYVLYIRPVNDGKLQPIVFPVVGSRLVHHLGRSDDQERLDKDKKNPMWPKIQDGARPAWAPDLLRLGYVVAFKREGLPRLAVRLGLKNPEKMKAEGRSLNIGGGGKRVLTFDDVWLVGITPMHRPMGMPNTKLPTEDWWLGVTQVTGAAAPYVVPGGGEVVVGAQRLSDVVSAIMRSPAGFPRPVPGLDDETDDLSEFTNPTLPMLPVVRNEADQPGRGGVLDTYSGIELFRY